MPRVTLTDLSYSHFDGTPVVSPISTTFSGKVGIVGANGSGKTTLMRLIAGELLPTSGTILRTDEPRYIPQNLTPNLSDRLADLMGIAEKLAALRAIQSGAGAALDYDILGDDWDLEERALAVLHTLGLAESLDCSSGVLDRSVGTLSGGEAMVAALAGMVVRRPAILLCDEPTSNLDSHARRWFYQAVERWTGCLLVVSHDPDLLERMDSIAQLQNGTLTLYGCSFSRYLDLVQAEKETADRRVAEAEARLEGERKRSAADQTRAARSAKQGVRAQEKSRYPTAAVHLRKSAAEKSAAKQKVAREERCERAHAALTAAKAAARPDDRIVVELPDTEIPAGRTAVELEADGHLFQIQGPERIALLGRNGSGKTTLFRTLLGQASLPGIQVGRVIPEIGYLPQRFDDFDNAASTIDNIRRFVPELSANQAHATLARFLFRNDRAYQLAGTLSGGERLRLALACLLSTRPAPRLLLLDEPTNNLDRQSIAELIGAIQCFRGALIAVSHDEHFLRSIGVGRAWTMKGMHLGEQASPFAGK